MFRFFKRTKIEIWEIDFLEEVFLKLADQIGISYYNQVRAGLLRSVMLNSGDIPNYVGFTYHSAVYKRYYKPMEENYKISNILVKDFYSGKFLKVSIYMAYGIVTGYAIDQNHSKYKFITADIDIHSVKKMNIGENDNVKIYALLSNEEQKFVNKNDLYVISVKGKEYYHLKELEDGDFLGIDNNGESYKITHDPLEITLVSLEERLKLLKEQSH
ncbi:MULTISPECIES: hypothetical protein [unclassified Myroides]|uniref:hypothetical protein n=1 Tax=unclassified Myroides TaxID=2642485 RepID=UPI0015FE6813|nr:MULTISPECIES: hypothetical protein [unclassified Myroides]MBB1150182.1 hypothetical protein [Myroides sp. NP-2]MDM1407270.1 hypothetical protein [Myroides sp. DF42-4-2]